MRNALLNALRLNRLKFNSSRVLFCIMVVCQTSAFFKKIVLLILALLFSISLLNGNDINNLKIKIKNRKPHIERLLQTHKVGENNKGYLSIRKELSREEKKWVKAENRDRSKLYDRVAAETNYYISRKELATQRARNIRQSAPPGIWIQRKEGTWILNK